MSNKNIIIKLVIGLVIGLAISTNILMYNTSNMLVHKDNLGTTLGDMYRVVPNISYFELIKSSLEDIQIMNDGIQSKDVSIADKAKEFNGFYKSLDESVNNTKYFMVSYSNIVSKYKDIDDTEIIIDKLNKLKDHGAELGLKLDFIISLILIGIDIISIVIVILLLEYYYVSRQRIKEIRIK